jgi:hypothetical protein
MPARYDDTGYIRFDGSRANMWDSVKSVLESSVDPWRVIG